MAGDEVKVPKFERWKTVTGNGHSWAFRAFQAHHAELNTDYWSIAAAQAFANKHHDSTQAKTADALRLGKTGWHGELRTRVETVTDEWKASACRALAAQQLHASVAMASALELYLRRAVRVALLSDPGAQVGRARSIDGAALAVDELYLSRFDDEATSCTSGSWSERIDTLVRLFGVSSLKQSLDVAKLQHLQDTRNAVAHIYGLTAQINEPYCVPYTRERRQVSRNEIKEQFELIRYTAQTIDKALCGHIGEFDSIYLYQRWRKTSIGGRRMPSNKLEVPKALSELLQAASFSQHGPGRSFCEGLVKWVDNDHSTPGNRKPSKIPSTRRQNPAGS